MSRHLIYKQKVTMNLPRKEEAFAFQTRVSDLLQNGLGHSLEAVLDQAFPPDKIVRIDSLSIDLGNINAQNFEQEFKTKFIEALAKSLSAKKEDLNIAKDENAILSKAQSLVNALIFFLERGYLPWYSSVEKMTDWETEVLNNLSEGEYRNLANWLKHNHQENPAIVGRLVLQFSDHFIGELLSKIAPATAFDTPWSLVFADYAFVLTSISDGTTADAHKKNKKDRMGSSGSGNIRPTFSDSVIRDKIWQYTFQVLLDAPDSDQAYAILKLLAQHFEIKTRDLAAYTKNTVNKGLKTTVIKHAFEKLAALLAANAKNSDGTESRLSYDERVDETEAALENDHENINSEDAEDGSPPGKTSAENKGAAVGNPGNSTLKNKTSENGKLRGNGNDDAEHISAQNKKTAEQGTAAGEDHKPLKGKATAQATNKKKNLPEKGDVISVHNCGVVILHPFLKPYFAGLDLLVDGNFINSEAKARGVLLLHYLATGETDAAEFDLTLQKILCGYPLEDTLASSIILTDKEIAQSDSLLNAVTNHWEPLKHTSIAGLRGSFLQRNGNIELKESGWLLKVEQRGFDILLAKLPWGFSTIRLPWMKNILSVDWY